MGLGEIAVPDVGKASQISCSVCLEPVTDNGERSWAKLQCGHQFHLDCIGSAFNFKGAMQCPNCRKIEKGQWLFASPSRSLPEVSMDDWAHDDDLYELISYEMTFGVQWCPFSGLTRMPSSFDEVDYPAVSYHDLVAQHHAMYEPLAASSASHPRPYIAYMGPVHPSSSGGSIRDNNNNNSSYNNHWNGASARSEVAAAFAFPPMDVHYNNNWEQQSLPFSASNSRGVGGADRLARPNSDAFRLGNFNHHFPAGYSSAARPGSSNTSMRVPPHPSSVARTRDRLQALQAYSQPLIPNAHRGYSQAASSSDQSEGFYYYPSASSVRRNARETASYFMNRLNDIQREYQEQISFSQTGRESIWGPPDDWMLARTRSQNR